MVSNMGTTWQERMLDCTGMPRNVIEQSDTINVAVIDRHYSAGRSFLNLPDVLSHLEVGPSPTTSCLLDMHLMHPCALQSFTVQEVVPLTLPH